jgi:hypothetical protein
MFDITPMLNQPFRTFATAKNIKTASAKKALRLMDQDVDYQEAVRRVSKEDNIPIKQLEKELEEFI